MDNQSQWRFEGKITNGEEVEVQLIEFDFIIARYVSGHRAEVIDLWSYLDWIKKNNVEKST